MANSQFIGVLDVAKRANGTGGDLSVAGALVVAGAASVGGVAFADKLDSVAVAPAFSATSTYAVDAVVTRAGRLYKCSTAVETAAEWDATKWTETNLITIIEGVANNGAS